MTVVQEKGFTSGSYNLTKTYCLLTIIRQNVHFIGLMKMVWLVQNCRSNKCRQFLKPPKLRGSVLEPLGDLKRSLVCVYEWTIIYISGIVIANIYCMYIVSLYGKSLHGQDKVRPSLFDRGGGGGGGGTTV